MVTVGPSSATPTSPSATRPPTPCTLFLFRHLQKTGGVSVRHLLHRLETTGAWLNYAEGTALYMEGSRRCSPSDDAEESSRPDAPLAPGCNRSHVSRIAVLHELSSRCARTHRNVRAMVELHTEGDFHAALDHAEAVMRPAGWRNLRGWRTCWRTRR